MYEEPNKEILWYTVTHDEALRRLKSDRITGLEHDEAHERLLRVGRNDLDHGDQVSWIEIFFRQFKSAFVYVLLIASVMSILLGDVSDGLVIFTVVLINALVGVIQEGKAKQSLVLLRREFIRTAKAIRGGMKTEIDARLLVPGDIVVLNRGDRVPADMRILEAERLFVNESTFTGESKDVQKDETVLKGKRILPDQTNTVFMGSSVTSGYGVGLVVETGQKTALGQLSRYLNVPEERTVLQKKIDTFAKKLAWIIALACSLLLIVGLFLGRQFVEMFTTSVAVAISAVPEGLAVVVTIILAIEMRHIFSLHGLVKTLPAAETLGSTTVVCTDKTGTVTVGLMTVNALLTENHVVKDASHSWYQSLESKPEELLRLFEMMLLCNDASEELKDGQRVVTGNMTDRALYQFVKGLGFSPDEFTKRFPRLDTVPFDSGAKYMATLHQDGKSNKLVVKGSPESILTFCSQVLDGHRVRALDDASLQNAHTRYQEFTKAGLRVLAVCYKELPQFVTTLEHYPIQECVFVGFVGLKDTVREGVREMVSTLRHAHVKTMLITGDHIHTAQVVARAIGLPSEPSNILEGSKIQSLSVSALMGKLHNISVCARIVPEDKLKIVQALQENGEVVAMTGDGVNDAPAIQKADIGVALGSGTDVAKESADIILLDDSFTTIGRTLLSGRSIIKNIRKVLVFLLSDNFTELFMMLAAFVLGFESLPLVASQILWKNLIADGLPAIALSSSRNSEDSSQSRPEPKSAPLLSRAHSLFIISASLLSAVTGLIVYSLYANQAHTGVEYARSAAFCVISLISLGIIFVVKSLGRHVAPSDFTNDPWMLASVGFSLLLLLLAFLIPFMRSVLHLVPLSLTTIIQLVTLSGFVVFVTEYMKRFLVRLRL